VNNRCDAAESRAGNAETGKVRAVIASERKKDYAGANQRAERRESKVAKDRENAAD
jgi:hypothetical protein